MRNVDFCLEKKACVGQSQNPAEVVHFSNETRHKCALLPRFILLAVKSSFQVTHLENQKMELVSHVQCRLLFRKKSMCWPVPEPSGSGAF
jgi:hypothetical protein